MIWGHHQKYDRTIYYVEEVQPMGGLNLLIAKTMYKHAVQTQRATSEKDGFAQTSETLLNPSLASKASTVLDSPNIPPSRDDVHKSIKPTGRNDIFAAAIHLLKSGESRVALNRATTGRQR